MGIRVTANNDGSAEGQQYPILKERIMVGHIVLFTAPRTGTMLKPEDGTYTIGEHSTGWYEDAYEVYNGSITLENVNG